MWKVEVLKRSGQFILVFYCIEVNVEDRENRDESYQVRGQIELETEEEKEKWLTLVNSLNK